MPVSRRMRKRSPNASGVAKSPAMDQPAGDAGRAPAIPTLAAGPQTVSGQPPAESAAA
jgi:hypothetical protein